MPIGCWKESLRAVDGSTATTASRSRCLAFLTSASDGGNMWRPLDALLKCRLIARLSVPRLLGGRPVAYFTVICTSEDRSGQSHADLVHVAKERNLPFEDYDGGPILQDEGSQFKAKVLPAQNGRAILHGEGMQTFIAKGANLHIEEHNVEVTVEKGIKEEPPNPHAGGNGCDAALVLERVPSRAQTE